MMKRVIGRVLCRLGYHDIQTYEGGSRWNIPGLGRFPWSFRCSRCGYNADHTVEWS